MQSAGSWKLEAGLAGSGFVLSLDPQASGLNLISALADGLMLVFKHPADGQVDRGLEKNGARSWGKNEIGAAITRRWSIPASGRSWRSQEW
jgi:hypothetical protein